MSSPRHAWLSRAQKRDLQRGSSVVEKIRERKAALPFHSARARVRSMVDAGDLPPGCDRVMEAMARCYDERGAGIKEKGLPLLIGYGLAGDAERLAARARSHVPPPVFIGIAEESGLSRRWAIYCVALIVSVGVLQRWYGGPKRDPRENVKSVLQRPTVAGRTEDGRPIYGERREHVHGIGGTGLANAYTVNGIPEPPVEPEPRPPEPPRGPQLPDDRNPDALRRIREITEGLERDRVERQRRRLNEQASRGP